MGGGLRLQPRRGPVPGARALAVRALRPRRLSATRPLDEAARARRALEEERRLFYVALTRARTTSLADGDGGAARGVRPLALALLPGGAAVSRRESRARASFVSAEEALAALRRAGGGPAGWRDHVETTNANAMLPTGGLWTSRLAPGAVRELPAAVLLRQPARDRRHPHDARCGSAASSTTCSRPSTIPSGSEPQTLERLLELAGEQSFEEVKPRAARGRAAPRCSRRLLRNYFESEVAPGLDARGARGRAALPLRARRVDADAATSTGSTASPDGRLRLIDYKTSKRAMKTRRGRAGPPARPLRARLPRGSGAERARARSPSSSTSTRAIVARGRARPARADGDARPRRADARADPRATSPRSSPSGSTSRPRPTAQWCEFKQICPRHHGRTCRCERSPTSSSAILDHAARPAAHRGRRRHGQDRHAPARDRRADRGAASSPGEILCLTFTVEATKEMRRRVLDAFADRDGHRPRRADRPDLPRVRRLDPARARAAARSRRRTPRCSTARASGSSRSRRSTAAPSTDLEIGWLPTFVGKAAHAATRRCSGTSSRPLEVARLVRRAARRRRGRARARSRPCAAVEAYRALKRERNAIDFGDQIALAVELLRDAARGARAAALPASATSSSTSTRTPTSPSASSSSSSAPTRQLVCAVGDVDQGIFGWRGATIHNMFAFPRRLPRRALRDALDQLPLRASASSTSRTR